MTIPELAKVLEQLGCPGEKTEEMARLLDRRARMDADREGSGYDAALERLLGLMAQGWAVPKKTAPPESGAP